MRAASVRRVILLPFVLATGCLFIDPCAKAPPPDDCEDPGAAIASLELGRADEDRFVPLEDGEPPALVEGGQGLRMLGVRLRVDRSAPACLGQRTRLESLEGIVEAEDDVPRRTYAQPDGTRATEPIWFLDWPRAQRFRVVAEVGGVTVSREVDRRAYLADLRPPDPPVHCAEVLVCLLFDCPAGVDCLARCSPGNRYAAAVRPASEARACARNACSSVEGISCVASPDDPRCARCLRNALAAPSAPWSCDPPDAGACSACEATVEPCWRDVPDGGLPALERDLGAPYDAAPAGEASEADGPLIDAAAGG